TTSSRLRARDLDERTKEYVMCAIRHYRCILARDNLFPDHIVETVFAKRAWDDACEEFGERLPLMPTIAKLITNRGPHSRGELKTKIKPLAEAMLGFKSGHSKNTIAFNRDLAEKLKEGTRFAYKDVEQKKGLFKAPILQKGANAIYFANRRDKGITHPAYFNPFLLRGLAGLLAVVDNAIDEYATGIRTDVPFTANEYRSIYENHVKCLELFAEHTAKYQLLDKILVRMHNIGRYAFLPLTRHSF
ncbi:hypothetical protein B0H19DRAFT_1167267, partial [Mycena capillaripes]